MRRKSAVISAQKCHSLGGATMLRHHNGPQFLHGLFHRVVHHEVVVIASGLHLHLGAEETALDLLGGIGATGGEAALQFLPRGRCDKDPHHIGTLGIHLLGSQTRMSAFPKSA